MTVKCFKQNRATEEAAMPSEALFLFLLWKEKKNNPVLQRAGIVIKAALATKYGYSSHIFCYERF